MSYLRRTFSRTCRKTLKDCKRACLVCFMVIVLHLNRGPGQLAITVVACNQECFKVEKPAANQRVHEMVQSLLIMCCLERLIAVSSLVNLLPIAALQKDCIAQLSTYLAHQYPRVRSCCYADMFRADPG